MSPQNVQLYTEIITERDEIAFERGIEEGVAQGLREGELRHAVRTALRQTETKFGTLDETLRQRIIELPFDSLEDLSVALLNFQTVDELQSWLDANA